jgi:hypothetical protein
MGFYSWADGFASRRRRPPWARTQCTCRRSAPARLSLEALENRNLPSVSPIPIPASFNPGLGGPDIHFQLPGPADNINTGRIGGEPSTITDFNGFIGVAQVTSTGTDNSGNALLWRTDVRFMTGVYRGVDGNLHQGTFAEV